MHTVRSITHNSMCHNVSLILLDYFGKAVIAFNCKKRFGWPEEDIICIVVPKQASWPLTAREEVMLMIN